MNIFVATYEFRTGKKLYFLLLSFFINFENTVLGVFIEIGFNYFRLVTGTSPSRLPKLTVRHRRIMTNKCTTCRQWTVIILYFSSEFHNNDKTFGRKKKKFHIRSWYLFFSKIPKIFSTKELAVCRKLWCTENNSVNWNLDGWSDEKKESAVLYKDWSLKPTRSKNFVC